MRCYVVFAGGGSFDAVRCCVVLVSVVMLCALGSSYAVCSWSVYDYIAAFSGGVAIRLCS